MRPDEFTKAKMEWLEALACCPAVPPLGLRACMVIAMSYVNREIALETGDMIAWPSLKSLATKLNPHIKNLDEAARDAELEMKRKGLAKALNGVKEAGYLAIKPGQGRRVNTQYRLLMPAPPRPSKTPPDSGLKPQEKAVSGGPFPPPKRPPAGSRKGHLGAQKRPSPVPMNPLKEPYDVNPATRTATLGAQIEAATEREGSAAHRFGEDEKCADEIFAIIPRGSASRSNQAKVRSAVAQILSTGTTALSLKIAVAEFVRSSPDATDQDGRFMGAAHTWLTEKRGWESYLPSPDEMFLHEHPEIDARWLFRVRSWQRNPAFWRMGQDDPGPEPDANGTMVPSAVLAFCLANPVANLAIASKGHSSPATKRVGFV